MKTIKLTPIHSAKQCSCPQCGNHKKDDCIRNHCACCTCYETDGSLAVKSDGCSCCQNKEESEDHCSDDDDDCHDDCCDQDENQNSDEALPINQTAAVTIYQVSGMDCPACARTIEKSVTQMPGIVDVKVHYSTGKMHVVCTDPSSLEPLPKQVSKLGYQVIPENRVPGSVQKSHANQPLWEIILSGACIAAGFGLSFTSLPIILPSSLFAIALIISGRQPVRSAYYALKSRSLDMNVLMSAAAIGALCIHQWFEAATVVWLFALGAVLEKRSVEKTRRSISDLMNVTPRTAWIKSGNQFVKKPVGEVAIDEIMVVRPGERIPLDGLVTGGESSVNQAPITGESIPVDESQSDPVFAGTLNENGTLECKVTQLSSNTAITQIIQMVEEAQEKQSPTQTFVDRFARIYTPIVFILALVVMIVPPLLGLGTWSSWFYRGLELLVVACPCALVISTPVAIVSAIGNAAKQGVLIKGGSFLEKAGHIQSIAFDKTGTITEGKPKVTRVLAFNGSDSKLLSLAKTLENYSTHPIARCLSGYANEQNILALAGTAFKNIPGKGVQANIGGTVYYAGSQKLFREKGVGTLDEYAQAQKLQDSGQTLVMIGTDQVLIGVIGVSDTIRQSTVSALNQLKKTGIRDLVMLTGDNQTTAQQVAKEAGITRYFADLLPQDKVVSIKKLQASGLKTAMVGDGINDAPALANADLGIAMGGAGTDTAMETADIVLMADHLEKLPFTFSLSRKSSRIMKQNIAFALIVKAAALILIFPGWLTLWLAVFSDTGAALLVILNSLRLFKIKN